MLSMQDRLNVALEIAQKTGDLIRRRYHSNKGVIHRKSATEWTTSVDEESEKLVRRFLNRKDPQSGVYGEELGLCRPEAENWWCIDPLDGTSNFIQDIPFFSVSIAYLEKGVPTIGVIYDPIRQSVYYAKRGGGAYFQNKKIKKKRKISDLSLYALNLRAGGKIPTWMQKKLRFAKLRNLGSMALQLCHVAGGALDFCISDKSHIWDIAAAAVILTECKGKMISFSQKPVFPLKKNWSQFEVEEFVPFVALSPSFVK